ncbi:MAG: hypothetical protein V2I82_05095 [Halieaceae bacterium]|nr:hypothetical protein [Halieaceae bacterium]
MVTSSMVNADMVNADMVNADMVIADMVNASGQCADRRSPHVHASALLRAAPATSFRCAHADSACVFFNSRHRADAIASAQDVGEPRAHRRFYRCVFERVRTSGARVFR